MPKEVNQALYEICELVKNDPAGSAMWPIHFERVITALINKKTLSWRLAHEEALKSLGVLGAHLQAAEKRIKQLDGRSKAKESA